MKNSFLKISLLLFIVADLGYSFSQYYEQKFDGDLIPIILPSEHYATVLEHPFGEKALLMGESYSGSNRYFAHQCLQLYFKNVPLLLQRFMSPISSLYASAAIFKLLTQILLTLILCAYILREIRFSSTRFLAIFLLITPFFQTYGYSHNIGIIDDAITYTFFYAFYLTLLLLFCYPFYKKLAAKDAKKTSAFTAFVLLILSITLPLSGPIIAPLGLMILFFLALKILVENKTSSKKDLQKKFTAIDFFLLFVFASFCLYSYFLSSFNAENQTPLSYTDGLTKCLQGLFFISTSKLAVPLFLLILIVNFFLIKKQNSLSRPAAKNLLWLWCFLLFYLLLLPLGGFREYRPNIIRHDTFIPVTLGFIFTISWTTKLVFAQIQPPYKTKYWGFIAVILIIFTLADKPNYDNNDCERKSLLTLQNSKTNPIELDESCTIFSWVAKKDYPESAMISEMLQYWNITEETILFRQKE